MTLNLSMAANATAYDFCASRVGRCVKRKLRPESTNPSLLSPTSATPCPSSEGGSMTIAKGPVSIFTSPRFYVTAQCGKNPPGVNRRAVSCAETSLALTANVIEGLGQIADKRSGVVVLKLPRVLLVELVEIGH